MCRPAILKTIDPNRFGGISPNFSTIHALISMTQWERATGGTSAAVRTVLLDYTKAFDSIDHRILFQQILRLDILYEIQYWVRDFLTDKYERIKIANDCYFYWGHVPLCVTQGTKLGSLVFVIMINDRELLN